MSFLLRSLTALAVLVHTLVGCCAHQSHAAAHSGCSHGSHQSAGVESTHHEAKHSEEHHHYDAHAEHQESSEDLITAGDDCSEDCSGEPGDGSPHSCHHTSCFWTTGDVGAFQLTPQAAFSLLLAVDHQSPLKIISYLKKPLPTEVLASGGPELPVRSHLAVGVLLI